MKNDITVKTAAVILAIIAVVSILGTVSVLTKQGVAPIITGLVTGTATVTVVSDTTISVPSAYNTVAFGNIALGASNETRNESDPAADTTYPTPFTVQNDGNVWVNITIYATALWAETGVENTSAYQANSSIDDEGGFNGTCETGDANCGNLSTANSGSYNISWNVMPIGSASDDEQLIAAGLNFTNNSVYRADRADIHINITVPSAEPPGAKSSTVTFTGSAY